jgi:hypothetical protein
MKRAMQLSVRNFHARSGIIRMSAEKVSAYKAVTQYFSGTISSVGKIEAKNLAVIVVSPSVQLLCMYLPCSITLTTL